ncbi:MAG: metal-dependent hydrolase, partial [Candidatus Sulfotelmatobacter sp.]
MASPFSHAVAALSIGTCFYRPEIPKRVWIAGVLCSVVPDLDVIGFRFGIHYGDFWGHRGFTHSLVFAALLASIVAIVMSSGVTAKPANGGHFKTGQRKWPGTRLFYSDASCGGKSVFVR